MNDKFDELAKGMAQSVTRRQALRHFGGAFVAVVLASLGLVSNAAARSRKKIVGRCQVDLQTGAFTGGCILPATGPDPGNCNSFFSSDCVGVPRLVTGDAQYCYAPYDSTFYCHVR